MINDNDKAEFNYKNRCCWCLVNLVNDNFLQFISKKLSNRVSSHPFLHHIPIIVPRIIKILFFWFSPRYSLAIPKFLMVLSSTPLSFPPFESPKVISALTRYETWREFTKTHVTVIHKQFESNCDWVCREVTLFSRIKIV